MGTQGENKESEEILYDEWDDDFLDAKSNLSRILQRSTLASQAIFIGAKKASLSFDGSNDDEKTKVFMKTVQDDTTRNSGGNHKAFSKKAHSSKRATQVSLDTCALKPCFSAYDGDTPTGENIFFGVNVHTNDAMNDDFSLADDDWDETSFASMFNADENLPSQDDADYDGTNQCIQDINSSLSNDEASGQKGTNVREAGSDLFDLSEGWTVLKIYKNRYTENRYKSPKLKLEFKSYCRALEFDTMQATHPQGEEAAALDYMSKVGGYRKLQSYVCALNKHVFLQKAKDATQNNEELLKQTETPVKHSPSNKQIGCPAELSPLAEDTDSIFDSNDPVHKSECNEQHMRLISRGWRRKKCTVGAHGKTKTRWLSPELKIEFRLAKAAIEFDKICDQYKCKEEYACGHYLQKLKKQRRRIGDHVVGGRPTLEAVASRFRIPSPGMDRDKPLIVENDDECYICEEGGDLICCDYCEKSFHLDCHIPRLLPDQIPSENWKCCECKAHEMPLMRCGECKDCTAVCEPRPKCKYMRFAEPEVLLHQGKRKHYENPPNSVRYKKQKKVVVSAAVDVNCHGDVRADGSNNGERKGFEAKMDIKQRKDILILKGWRCNQGYSHHKHWLSPKRKLEFTTIEAAEEFEDACQACMGNEEKASVLYLKRMQQQGRSLMHSVVGGASALRGNKSGAGKTIAENLTDRGAVDHDVIQENSSSKAFKSGQLKKRKDVPTKWIKNHRESDDLLLSQGWVKKVTQHHPIKRYLWVSPRLKLQFTNRKEATSFNVICQEDNTDEACALLTYAEKIEHSGRLLSKIILGGKGLVERIAQQSISNSQPTMAKPASSNQADNPIKGPRNQKTRIQEALGPGWAKKSVLFKTQWRSIYVSPKLKIQFKFLRDANLYHSLRQKNYGNDNLAWKEYTRYKRSQKCARNVMNLEDVYMLTSGDKPRKQIASSTIHTEQIANIPSVAATDLTQNSDISEKKPSPASSFLEELSCGWSQVEHKYRNNTVVHYKSPQHGVEFRSFKRAKSFDHVLRRNHYDESKALENFIRQNGRDKFRNMTSSYGTYELQASSQDGSITPAQKALAEFQANTDPLSGDSSVMRSRQGNIVDEDYWEVHKIMAQRFCNRRMEYLVRWKGCSSKDDTWEPAENLCDSAIEEAAMLPNLLTKDPRYRESLQKVLRQAIALMKEIDQEKVFHDPVTDDMAPEYSRIINKPICLSTMEEKVMRFEYKTIDEFTADSMQMFSNCIKYNNEGQEGWLYQKEAERQRRLYRKEVYHKATEELERHLEGLTESQRNQLGSSKNKSLTKSSAGKPQKTRSLVYTHRSSSHPASAGSINKAGARCSVGERSRSSFRPSTPRNKIGSMTISSTRMGQEKLSFFSHYFEGLVKTLEVPFGDETGVEKTIIDKDGNMYELLSYKVPKKVGASFRFMKQPDIEFLYVNTDENGLQMMNLQKELEEFCSFGSLDKRKIIARLGHLQSEAAGVMNINLSDIEIIQEKGHEGCGFIPPNFFEDSKDCPYSTSDALQVRIIAPKLGLIKGMLLVKRGIKHIQIPESMIKVMPSKSSNKKWATVIFKKLYAPSTQNKLLGRMLDPNGNPPNSFKVERQKSLSDMYQRILIGFGVPKLVCDDYVKLSRNVEKLRHAHLMGVADPTGSIPYGEVFIPGYARNSKANNARDIFGSCLKYGKVFISRSPCLEPTDAKILSVLKRKPNGMSAKDWESLCAYKFGTVIFGLPKSKDDTPIPCLIADGDLDGDLYFVLWDDEILDNLLHPKNYTTKKAFSLLTKLEAIDKSKCFVNKSAKLDKPYQKNWFSSAQDEMVDVKKIGLSTKLVGSLYRLCQMYSKKDNGFFDIYDEDALAFAQAYKDSMDVQKHGGKSTCPLTFTRIWRQH
eukprot:CCRYP_011281-RE/>CCRYP_011281-RE protein AED:0.21 eAED:0.21 QI:965/1/1/1/0.88/0.84/19/194/1883